MTNKSNLVLSGLEKSLHVQIVTLFLCAITLLLKPMIVMVFAPLVSVFFYHRFKVFIFAYILVWSLFYSSAEFILDLLVYESLYNRIEGVDIFSGGFAGGIEFVIIGMMKFASLFDFSFRFFLLCTYIIIFSFLYKALDNFCGRWAFLVFACIIVGGPFLQANSLFLRQMLSVSFFILVLSYGEINFKGRVLSILAVFSHISSVLNVFLIYALLSKLSLKRKMLIICFGCSVTLFFLFLMQDSFILVYIWSKFDLNALASKYDTLNLIYIAIPILFSIYTLLICRVFSVRFNHKALLVFMVVNLIVFLCSTVIPGYANRIGLVAYAFSPMWLIFLVSSANVCIKYKYFFVAIPYIFSLLFFLYINYNVEMQYNDINFLNHSPLTATIFSYVEIYL